MESYIDHIYDGERLCRRCERVVHYTEWRWGEGNCCKQCALKEDDGLRNCAFCRKEFIPDDYSVVQYRCTECNTKVMIAIHGKVP